MREISKILLQIWKSLKICVRAYFCMTKKKKYCALCDTAWFAAYCCIFAAYFQKNAYFFKTIKNAYKSKKIVTLYHICGSKQFKMAIV